MAKKPKGQQVVPEAALRYWQQKKHKESWDYRDVWKSEHAAAFTVAKTAGMDVLDDLHQAVEHALKNGQSYRSFSKGLDQYLYLKGWWGKDPETGAQLGSYRRLKTIYETNMRQSHNAGRYQQGMLSEAHPYILYRLGPSRRHRKQHAAWDGLCLPKDDPFWDTHHPMNGWGCKCYTRFVSKRKYKEYSDKGVPRPVLDKTGQKVGEIRRKMQTARPQIQYKDWLNKKTGQIERVPVGMDPGFDWNPGGYGRSAQLASNLVEKAKRSDLANSEQWIQDYFQHPIVREDYQAFVQNALSKPRESLDRTFSAVGLLPDWALQEFRKRGGKRKRNAKNGLLLIDAKLLQEKDAKHNLAPGSSGLLKQQWLDLPNWLQNYDKVTWDDKYNSLIYWKKLENGWVAVAIAVNHKGKVQAITAKVDYIRTAYIYKETSWQAVMQQRQNRDQLVRER